METREDFFPARIPLAAAFSEEKQARGRNLDSRGNYGGKASLLGKTGQVLVPLQRAHRVTRVRSSQASAHL